MVAMPKHSSSKKPKTLRIDADLMERLVAIGERAEFKPTLTQLIERAIGEYVERHGSPPAPKPPKPSR